MSEWLGEYAVVFAFWLGFMTAKLVALADAKVASMRADTDRLRAKLAAMKSGNVIELDDAS